MHLQFEDLSTKFKYFRVFCYYVVHEVLTELILDNFLKLVTKKVRNLELHWLYTSQQRLFCMINPEKLQLLSMWHFVWEDANCLLLNPKSMYFLVSVWNIRQIIVRKYLTLKVFLLYRPVAIWAAWLTQSLLLQHKSASGINC